MKAILISILSLGLSTSAFAASGAKHICKEVDAKIGASKRTFVITQFGEARLEEGKTYAFGFQVYDGLSKEPLRSTKVFATLEDVQFTFGNHAEGINGTIFLDEMYQAYLTMDGQEISLNCQ